MGIWRKMQGFSESLLIKLNDINTYNDAMTEGELRSDFELHKYTPYFTFMGEFYGTQFKAFWRICIIS